MSTEQQDTREQPMDPYAVCRIEGGHGWVYKHGSGIPKGVTLRECMICPTVEVDIADAEQAAERRGAVKALRGEANRRDSDGFVHAKGMRWGMKERADAIENGAAL